MLKILLNRAESNEPDLDLTRPLLKAVTLGDEAIIKLLLDKGTDIDAENGYHLTLLFGAMAYGRKKLVDTLLQRGASTKVQGLWGTHHWR